MSPSIESGPILARWRRIPGPPRDRIKARLLRLYAALERRFGPQRLLVPRRLDHVSETELAGLIRSAGTHRVKARGLKTVTRWLGANVAGRFDGLRSAPLSTLRRELLGVSGLGPETVDAILLYAGGRPVFVADSYTRRVLARHGLFSADLGYEAAREFLETHLPSDPRLFNEFHALLVAVGKRYCREIAHCEGCPLRGDLTTWGASKGPPGAVRRTRSADSPGARRRRGPRGSAPARPSP